MIVLEKILDRLDILENLDSLDGLDVLENLDDLEALVHFSKNLCCFP